MTFSSIRRSRCSRVLSLCLIVAFVTSMVIAPKAQAGVMGLPQPGTMVDLSSAYVPLMITGLSVHPENPLLMDFIVNTGNSGLNADQVKKESDRLIKYFLACLTIPENNQWVNLSPYEKQRIVPDDLGQTVLGQDMLAQDYLLKQLTASLIYPEKNLGKDFWDNVYTKASQMYGTSQIPVNTFNKVWILPDTAKVYEHNNTVFVVKSHLKVMLDEDYLALKKHADTGAVANPVSMNNLGSQIVRQIILPAIEKEVNYGQNFAQLRQIYNSMILAVWFKKNLKQALLNQVYTDRSKVNGVNADDPAIKEKIYKQYLQAYKKGVFNYIKEEMDQGSQQVIPRKYFSGGLAPVKDLAMATEEEAMNAINGLPGDTFEIKGRTKDINGAQGNKIDASMLTQSSRQISADLESSQNEKIESIRQSAPLVFSHVRTYLEQANDAFAQAQALPEDQIEAKNIILIQILSTIQKIIVLPQLALIESDESDALSKSITDLWISLGETMEQQRVNAIKALINREGIGKDLEKKMSEAHVVFENGEPRIEDLQPDVWSPYSSEIWAPYLVDSLADLIRKTDVNLDEEGKIILPGKIGHLSMALVKALAKSDNPVDRLKEFVKIEGDVRKDPGKGLELAQKLDWGEIQKREDFQHFIQDFLEAMRLMKWSENWESKKDAVLKERLAWFERIKSELGLNDLDTKVFAARILSRNIPFDIVEQVANNQMVKGEGFIDRGDQLIRKGYLRMVAMAGGSASRWKTSLASLINKGLIDPEEVPDNLPRALAAYWTGNYKDGGETGVSLMLNNLTLLKDQGYNASVAEILSPFTWKDFMRATYQAFGNNANRPKVFAIAQNSSKAQVMEEGAMTDEDLSGKVLGHGNVRGWLEGGVIEGLKNGVVVDLTRSADNPFTQLNQIQVKEIIGRMAAEHLVHVAVGNWRSIGQAGGGFVDQRGVANVIDTPISNRANSQGFLANRDINIFSTLTNFINNAALLYAVSSKEDNLITWDQVEKITGGDEQELAGLKDRLEQLTPEQIERFTNNFIDLLPSEFVKKSEGKAFVQWEQISGMLHGALPKAINERQRKDGVPVSEKLNMAYVDISRADYRTLNGQNTNAADVKGPVPMFIEVKGVPDLEESMEEAGKTMKILASRGIFNFNVKAPALWKVDHDSGPGARSRLVILTNGKIIRKVELVRADSENKVYVEVDDNGKLLTQSFSAEILGYPAQTILNMFGGNDEAMIADTKDLAKTRPAKFGTSGDRGIIDWDGDGSKDFNIDLVRRDVQGIAAHLLTTTNLRTIIIGYDTRYRNPEFSQEAARIMAGNGFKVLYVAKEAMPTPVLAILAANRNVAGVINFTASHSPYTDGGLKFSPSHGGAADTQTTDSIEKFANEADTYKVADYDSAVSEGQIVEIDPRAAVDEYVNGYLIPTLQKTKATDGKSAWDDIVSYIKNHPEFNLVIDPMQGTGVRTVQALYGKIAEAAGRSFFTVIHTDNRDPKFTQVGGAPQPAGKYIKGLLDAVSQAPHTMGIAIDGDVDRFGVVDFGGKQFEANEMIGMFAWFLKKDIGLDGSLVKTVATSNFANAVAQHLGMKLIETPVGFKYSVQQVLNGENVLVAGEESAHVAIGPFMKSWDDGFAVGLTSLWMVARSGKSLAEYKSQIESEIGQSFVLKVETKRDEQGVAKANVIALIAAAKEEMKTKQPTEITLAQKAEELTHQKVAGINTMDGIKLVFETGDSILMRPSGTEPAAKLYVEVSNAERLEPMLKAASKLMGADAALLTEVNSNSFDEDVAPGVRQKDNAALAKTPEGGIDLNSRTLNMESTGQKVNITFDPLMIAQFKRGDFSGVRIQILDVVPVNLMPLLGLKEDI